MIEFERNETQLSEVTQAKLSLQKLVESLTCPISLQMMCDPVLAFDSKSYERAWITAHFERSNRSPLLNIPIDNKSLISNDTLREVIQNAFEAHELCVQALSVLEAEKTKAEGHAFAAYDNSLQVVAALEVEIAKANERIAFLERTLKATLPQSDSVSRGHCFFQSPSIPEAKVSILADFKKGLAQNIATLEAQAISGDTHAEAMLGRAFLQGWGVEKNQVLACRWLLRASRSETGPGLWALGMCHEYGLLGAGVQMSTAMSAFLKSYQLGYNPAAVSLGCGYLAQNFRLGSTRTQKAIELFHQASESGYAAAHVALGYCYLRGRGISQNTKIAVNLFQRALKDHHVGVLYYMGLCYLDGLGVLKNRNLAAEFLQLALEFHCEQARPYLKQLELENNSEGMAYKRHSA